MDGMYIPTAIEARKKIFEMVEKEVPEGGVISWGGSVTLINLVFSSICRRLEGGNV